MNDIPEQNNSNPTTPEQNLPERKSAEQSSDFSTGTGYAHSYAYDPTVYTKPPQTAERDSIYGILSLIIGILSIFLNCCCMMSGIPFSIASIVLAAVDKGKNVKMSGMSIAGLICSIVSLLGSVVLFVVMFVLGILSEFMY